MLKALWDVYYTGRDDESPVEKCRRRDFQLESFMMSSFWDCIDAVLLITSSNAARVVWRNRGDVEVHEAFVPLEAFMSASRAFLEWADRTAPKVRLGEVRSLKGGRPAE